MNIITALNKKYIPYTTVMLTSLAINEEEHVDAYLMHSELSDNDVIDIQKALEGFSISIIPIKVDRQKFSDRLPRTDQWSIEAYYRLMMFELLPDSIDRALYLDGDMVINKSLSSFYFMSFDGKEIIACDDKCGRNLPENYGSKHNEMFREAYAHDFRYFNSGVMLINFEQMRRNYSFNTYLDAFEAWEFQMEAPDQDILNWVHWKNVSYADFAIYNLFARVGHNAGLTYDEVKEGCAIIHFAGSKPWDNDGLHFDIEKLWWDYAKETPYYDGLLTNFVFSACTDRTIEQYFKNSLAKLFKQRELLDMVMEKINTISSKM